MLVAVAVGFTPFLVPLGFLPGDAFFLRFAVAKAASPYAEGTQGQDEALRGELVKFGDFVDYSGKFLAYPGPVTGDNSHKGQDRYGPHTKTHRQDPSQPTCYLEAVSKCPQGTHFKEWCAKSEF